MRKRKGQAMLIAILTLGGAILGATSLAGLLMVYQIRSTTDSENSAKAIFAADSGINWAIYDNYQGSTPPLTFFDSAVTVSTTCYGANDATTTCDNASVSYVIAKGTSLNSSRAFLLSFTAGSTTYP